MEASCLFVGTRCMSMASGTYMLRSERRKHYEPPVPGPDPQKKPEKPKKPKKEKKKRTQAGFIYKFFVVLTGIILWPIGLIMLFPKYLKWKPFSKFLTACVLLLCFVFLYGFLLTVNTGNADYTRIQDEINSHIETIASDAGKTWTVVQDKITEVSDGADNFLRACIDAGSVKLADIIDEGVRISQKARDQIAEWIGQTDLFVPEPTAEPTPVPTPEPTATPTPTDSNAEIDIGAETVLLPVFIPSATSDPESGTSIQEGRMTIHGLVPSATIEPDISVDADIVPSFTIKSVSSVKVYCNIGSGEYYHSKETCGNMKSSSPHTLKEALDAGMKACERCNPVSAELANEPYVAWIDENNLAHTSDTCTAFKGSSKVITAQDALDEGLEACPECDCDDYLAAVKGGKEITVVPLEQFE